MTSEQMIQALTLISAEGYDIKLSIFGYGNGLYRLIIYESKVEVIELLERNGYKLISYNGGVLVTCK